MICDVLNDWQFISALDCGSWHDMIARMVSGNRNRGKRAPWWCIALFAGLALVQGGGLVRSLWLSGDAGITLSVPTPVDVLGHLVWTILLGWTAWGLLRNVPQAVNRSIWLLSVFIIYGVLRLLAFAQADYDRQRFPLLLALIPLVLIILLCSRAVRGRSHTADRDQIMENESDGSRPQDSRTPPQT